MWERWKIDSKRLSRFTAVDILELATRGNVLIRGWGAAQLLRDVPHVICVRICAPMSKRVDEMKRRLGLDRADLARREIERSDDAHARTVQRRFQVDWKDPTEYDLVINTGYVPIDAGVALLQQLAKSGAYEPDAASRGMLQDKLVEARVQMILDRQADSSPTGTGPSATVTGGHVVIDGVSAGPGIIRESIAEIEQIEGVTSVADNTVSVPMRYGP